jgi:GT2 family glycosyltransferase
VDSLLELNIPNIEVIIVDSKSTDGTKEYLQMLSHSPEASKLAIKALTLDRRVKWSEANQIGLNHSKGEWICLSNPDIVFNESFLKMFDEIRGSGILVGAPQLVFPDGRLQRPAKTFTPWLSLCAHTRLVRLLLKTAGKQWTYLFPYDPDGQEIPVDNPQGSLFLFHRRVLDMFDGHLWNKGYQNGVSDFDAFFNLKENNIRVWLFPQYRIVHYGSYVSKKYPAWIERDQAYGFVLFYRYHPRMSRGLSPGLYSILFGLEGIAVVGVDIAGRVIKRRNPFFKPRRSAWVAGQRIMGLIDGWKYKIS